MGVGRRGPVSQMIRIEFILTRLSILLAFIFPNVGERWFEPLERGCIQLARRRGFSVIVVGFQRWFAQP